MNEGRCAIKHCFVSGESLLQSKNPQYADRVVRTNQMKKNVPPRTSCKESTIGPFPIITQNFV